MSSCLLACLCPVGNKKWLHFVLSPSLSQSILPCYWIIVLSKPEETINGAQTRAANVIIFPRILQWAVCYLVKRRQRRVFFLRFFLLALYFVVIANTIAGSEGKLGRRAWTALVIYEINVFNVGKTVRGRINCSEPWYNHFPQQLPATQPDKIQLQAV